MISIRQEADELTNIRLLPLRLQPGKNLVEYSHKFFRSTGLWFLQHVSCAMEAMNNVSNVSFSGMFTNHFSTEFLVFLELTSKSFVSGPMTSRWNFQIMVK